MYGVLFWHRYNIHTVGLWTLSTDLMDSDLATVTGTQEVFLSPDERKSQSVHIHI